MHYKGSSWSAPSRRRLLLGTLAFAAMAAAGILAATAMPAFAGGGNGHGNGHGNGGGQAASQSGSGGHNNGGGNAGGNGNGATHVTICHATPPDTAANGYVRISPSASGVYHGHLQEHAADIIPPFVYKGVTYSLNWDATGQAIWNNGCVVPSSTGGTTTSAGTTTTNTVTVTNTVTTTTSSAPATLGLRVVKLERIGATGKFVRGPLTASVGDTVFYEIVVDNTGNTPLDVTLSDPHCDAGTLLPTGSVTLAPSASTLFTCSHLLKSSDGTTYVNVATASGHSSSTSAGVVAKSTVRTTIAGGVAGAQKTKVKKVTHKARPSKAVVKAASYTG